MIQVISIGTDRRIFEEGSAVRTRLLKQRELFSKLHVIVCARRSLGFKAEQIGNLWLYPTNSLSRWLYVRDATALAGALVEQRRMNTHTSVITVQDPFECGLAGMRASRRYGKIPLHVQIHTDFLSRAFQDLSILNRVRVLIARRVLTYACGIRVVSERIKESLQKSDMRISAPIEVLPVFSDAGAIPKRQKSSLVQKGKDSSGLVLMVCRFATEKDVPTALLAFKNLLTMRHSARLVIVGEGPEKNKLIREIQLHGLDDSVRVEPWQSDLSAYYQSADVVLVTSRFEGYGLVLLEAARAARAVVTTDVGIARELIPPLYGRFICPVGDAVCVASGLHELLADVAVRRAYGAALKAVAKKHFIPEEEYWKLYRTHIERCIR